MHGLKAICKAYNSLVEGYDPEKSKTHILYLDADNTYGWAMNQPLATGGFRWVEDCERLGQTIAGHPANSPEGFILDVDLEYPRELHAAHNG
ncbi:MAG: hypothetical protein AB2693_13465 [Candidatus Thiodiazotropha sp.]